MSNLIELARRLHEEKLFVKSEQDTILKLNEQVRLNAEKLSHSFWITRNHYLNLNQLIGNVSSGNPATCSQRANQLEKVQFINAHDELGYDEASKYGQFLEAFINNPTLAAACLEYGDILSLESTAEVAQTIVLGCYGNSIITDNHKHLLELLEALLLLQIADDEQPRRLVQKGRCAFSIVYNLFAESLMPGKLFLMSALHQPIMKVLMDDELHLETDQVKILESLNEMEITKRFGRRSSDCFTEKLSQYIKQNEKFLAEICSMFVKNLVQAMASFPQSLGWVIARAYHIVKDARIVSADEAKALSADFLLQHFICPAIVDPERYGITGNVPVSKIARANLMQVAQVLQMAAHAKVPTTQNGQLDLMDQVKITMKDLIDVVISTCNAEGAPESKNVHGHVTSAIFLTSHQIAQFVLFLRQIQLSNVKGVDQSSLAKILACLPKNPPESITRATNIMLNQTYGQAIHVDEDITAVKRYSGASTSSNRSSPAASMMKSKTSNSTFDNNSPTSNPIQYSSSPSSGRKIFSKHLSKSKLKSPLKQPHHSHKEVDMMDELDSSLNVSSQEANQQQNEEKVLVITINNNDQDSSAVIPGTLSETEVLQIHRNNCTNNVEQNTTVGSSESLDIENGLEKQSQFSLYLGGSNLSEIGELGGVGGDSGASDRSPASGSRSDPDDIDMDQSENGVGVDDNSSFIAGGSSHGGNQDEDDMEEAGDLESVKRSSNDEALKDLRRKIPTSRESIEDKMRKFEIRKMGGSSVVVRGGNNDGVGGNTDTRSETWSVDVYASDSEQTNEQSEHERLREIAVDPADHIRRSSASMGSLLSGGGLGRGDEDSRSDIWSVEVLASDSEPPDNQSDYRLQDLDSEAASSVNVEDPSEDNRSRASTPGLSAASGYSAISALSLISDHQKNEPTVFNSGGGVNLFEQTTKQIATSSSISDVDELVTPTNQQHKSGITRAASDASSKIPREKSVAWNLPTQQDNQQLQSSSMVKSNEQVEDMMESSGTIKRSPYKSRITNSGGGGGKNNSRIPRVTPAWYDTSNQVDTTNVVSNELADLREFDPFASTPSPPPAPATDMLSAVPGGNLHNQTSTNNAAFMTSQSPSSSSAQQQQKSTSAAITTERQVASGDSKSSTTTPNTLLKGINQFLSANSTDSQEQVGGSGAVRMAAAGGNKSIERKKSWWKSGKFYKKSNSTASSTTGKSPTPSSGKPSRFSSLPPGGDDIVVDSLVSVSEAVVRTPGEDIMEKYMRKMTSSTSLMSSLTITDEMKPKQQQYNNNEVSRIGGDKIAPTPTSGSSQAPSNSSATTSGGGENSQYWQQQAQQTNNNNKKEQQQNTKEQRRNDAKRKLRIVLSMAEPRPELPSTALLLLGVSADRSVTTTSGANELYAATQPSTSSTKEQVKIRDQILSFVQAQLSQALVLQDSLRVAQLCEVKRCFSTIDNSMCRTIYQDLWREYNQRSAYIAYLVRARQHLLTASSYFRNIQQCIENDKTVCRRYFTHQCVRLFLKQRESRVDVFTRQFLRLVALDDKVSKIGEFLRELYGHLVADPMWEGTSEDEFNEAKCCIERFLFTSVYRTAMFPNGDADLSRDQLYREHITRLSASVTPSHPALQISNKYSFECPWQAAQVEARSIVTYRTPRGKLAAALRCCKTIMYLLKMADENEAPGADDFTPVLVYVLIMANPRHLLSTIQFVTAYIGDDLQGEDSYWWMQFTAATEFIKTIDERMK